MIMVEMLDYGFYHADPHPGNMLILEGGKIGVLDFGMVGRISKTMKLDLLDLLNTITSQDASQAVYCLEALGVAGVDANRVALVRDINHMFDRFLGQTLDQIDINELSGTLFAIIRRHHLQMPSDLVMLLKVLGMYEGTGALLDPDFNVLAVAAPFVKDLMKKQLSPRAWEPELRQSATDIARAGMELPGQLRRLARRVDQGEFTMVMQHQELDSSLNRLEAMVNRIAMSVLFGAFVIGLGLIVVAYRPDEQSDRVRWLIGIGFAMVLLLGAWLAREIFRSRRRSVNRGALRGMRGRGRMTVIPAAARHPPQALGCTERRLLRKISRASQAPRSSTMAKPMPISQRTRSDCSSGRRRRRRSCKPRPITKAPKSTLIAMRFTIASSRLRLESSSWCCMTIVNSP